MVAHELGALRKEPKTGSGTAGEDHRTNVIEFGHKLGEVAIPPAQARSVGWTSDTLDPGI